MRRSVTTIVSTSLLLGCTLLGANDSSLVIGSWGGDQVQVTATPTQLVITGSCNVNRFPGPIQRLHGDSFAATGITTASSSFGDSGRASRISGVIVGDTLRLSRWFPDSKTGVWEPAPVTEILVSGQTPVFFPVCPL